MEALQIMPIMAQNQSRFNLGEYAEEATIIQDEPTIHSGSTRKRTQSL